MTFTDAGPELPPPPSDIRCGACGRVLHALRQPRCNWCGMPVPDKDYQTIQAQSQHVLSLPDPVPLPAVISYAQQSDGYWNRRRLGNDLLPFSVRTFQAASPRQARLRVIVVALFGILAGLKICYLLYSLWMLHRLMHAMPH